jgi:hypothetical protein
VIKWKKKLFQKLFEAYTKVFFPTKCIQQCQSDVIAKWSEIKNDDDLQVKAFAESEQFQEPNSDKVSTPEDFIPSTSSSGTRAIVQEQLRSEIALIDSDLIALYNRRAVGFFYENQEKELRLKIKKKKEFEQTLKN